MNWLDATLYILGAVAFYNGTRVLLGKADIAEARLIVTLIWPLIVAWALVISITELSNDLYRRYKQYRAKCDQANDEVEEKLYNKQEGLK